MVKREMKTDTTENDLPEIPDTWIWKTLGETCERIFDGTHFSPKNGPKGDFKYITAKNIKSWGIDLRNLTYVSKEAHQEIYLRSPVKYKDILYIKDGATTGIAVVNNLTEQFSLLSSVGVFNVNNNFIIPEYVAYYLNSPITKTRMLNMVSGVAITRLTLEKLKACWICLPPLPEQNRIVAKLDQIVPRIDACKERLDKIPLLLKRFRQAVLIAACRGVLTDSWRKKYKRDKVKELVESEGLFETPESWTWTHFNNLTRDITVGHVGPMLKEYVENGIPFLRSMNVREMHINIKGLKFISNKFHSILNKSKLMPGDVVVVRSGNVGVCAVIPNTLKEANCSDLVIIRPDKLLNPYYACIFINSPLLKVFIEDNKVGIAQSHFNIGMMNKTPIPVPPLDEQTEIVRRVEALFTVADHIEARYKDAKAAVDKLTPSTLAKAFRGELVPQDPSDEPASVFLERIKATSGVVVKWGKKK